MCIRDRNGKPTKSVPEGLSDGGAFLPWHTVNGVRWEPIQDFLTKNLHALREGAYSILVSHRKESKAP